jgi:quercetin dioxygenase-like cupin family protein
LTELASAYTGSEAKAHQFAIRIKEEEVKLLRIAEVQKEPHATPLFTGPDVTMQSIVGPELSKIFVMNQVNFGRGVRSKFHSHTSEQVIIVTEGKGIVATQKEKVTVGPGDVIFVPAGEEHWHGAAKDATFSHLYVISPDRKTTQLEA